MEHRKKSKSTHGNRVQWLMTLLVSIILIFPNSITKGDDIDTKPLRVVSLGPIITEMIYLIEADEMLIANTTYCVAPPEAQFKDKIGSFTQMNVEKIVRLNPDVVLASGLSKDKQLKKLKNLGIKVIQFPNPKTFSEICEMTLRLGKLFGKEKKAEQIIGKTRAEVKAIQQESDQFQKKKVFMQIGIKPLHAAAKGSFISEYIEFGGGMNIASNAKSGTYSREKVLKENPDVILIATMGSSRSVGEKEKGAWMKFRSINAVKAGEVYILDPDLVCSPTPVTFVKGLKVVTQLIHPDIRLP